MPLTPRYVTTEQRGDVLFSVVSLVASDDKYKRMLTSFEAFGFSEQNAEFIAIDNRDGNAFDGYRALRAVAGDCRGRYILLTHDDIELIGDDAQTLAGLLDDLDRDDPRWTVAGNVGWTGANGKLLRHIKDPHGASRDVSGPVRVVSLDENFLVLPRSRLVLPSLDLEGFHLYATDLCVQASLAGGSSYVIPFYLEHHSAGSASAAFEESRARFEKKYASLQVARKIPTPAAELYIGGAGSAQKASDRVSAWLTQKSNGVGRRLTALMTGTTSENRNRNTTFKP